MKPLENLLQRLEGVQQKGNAYVARCPCAGHGKGHGDQNPSLSVAEGDHGRVLLKCHAGCRVEEARTT
jgi:putative DNA primase/helicase